jgi:hypothetical protein
MAVHTVTGSMARYGIVGVWSSYDVGLDLLEVEIINFQVTGIGLFSGSGFKTAIVTGDISATASLSGVGNIEAIIVGSIVGEGSLETDATGAHTGVAELDSLGDPQSEGTSTRSGEVDITGIGIFTPDGSKTFTDDGQIEGIGITVADVFKTGVANAIIVGEGIAHGDGASVRTVNAALDSIGNPAATGGINATDDGTIVGVGVLASNVIKNALQAGTIVGIGVAVAEGTESGVAAATRTFLGSSVSGTNATVYTFSSVALGDEAADRCIVVGTGGTDTDTTADPFTSVTVAGVTATRLHFQQGLNGTDTADVSCALYIAEVPTGTTGDIVVTYSNAQLRCGIGWYSAYGLLSTTATDTGDSTADPPSTTIDVEAGGLLFGYVQAYPGGSSGFTWTGITEDFDAAVEGTGNSHHSGASDEFASVQTGLTVTGDNVNAANPRVMVLAALR